MAKEQRVRIVADSDPMDPREWDNVGRMICWHPNYNLGDKHDYHCDGFFRDLAFEVDDSLEGMVDRLEGDVWDKLYDQSGSSDEADRLIDSQVDKLIDKAVRAVRAGHVILPLYLYDHSGITMRTGPFNCIFDSGQVGWIVCDNETIEREFNGDRELAEKCLESEVSVYDNYLTGNVYGFIVEETDEFDEDGEPIWDDCDELDSCWGFFGDDVRTNGMAEHLGSDDLVDLAVEAEVEYQ